MLSLRALDILKWSYSLIFKIFSIFEITNLCMSSNWLISLSKNIEASDFYQASSWLFLIQSSWLWFPAANEQQPNIFPFSCSFWSIWSIYSLAFNIFSFINSIIDFLISDAKVSDLITDERFIAELSLTLWILSTSYLNQKFLNSKNCFSPSIWNASIY